MAVNAAPASRSHRLPLEARWFHLAFRVILALLALWALHFAVDRIPVFQRDFLANARMEIGLWLAWVGSAAAAGFVFGIATWLPFGKVRYLWSRLVLAAVPLIPLAQFWWIYVFQYYGRNHPPTGLLARHVWFSDWISQTGVAILVGVAIASGFRTARSARDGE